MTWLVPSLVRDVLTFAALYVLIVWMMPSRWLPREGIRHEWKALLAAGLVTLLVMLGPALLLLIVLIRVGDWLWCRLKRRSEAA